MFRFAAFAAFCCLACFASAEQYLVKNTRASKLLGAVAGFYPLHGDGPGKATLYQASGGAGFIPEGVTVRADDNRSLLTIDGPDKGVKELVRFLQTLDTKPMTVRIDVDLACGADKYSVHSTLEVANNATQTMTDGVLGLGITLTPRINDDGTVTVYVAVNGTDSRVQAVVRVKADSPETISILDKEVSLRDRGKDLLFIDAKGMPKSWDALLAKDPERVFVRLNCHVARRH